MQAVIEKFRTATVDRILVCLFVAGLAVTLSIVGRLYWFPTHAPLNVNEGWNASQAFHAVMPGTLYPRPDALIANNYPPLSFAMIGWLARLTGDAILTGRAVSGLAQLAVAIATAVIVWRLGAGRTWASVAAALFAMISVTLARNYVLMDDPQWLAEALSTSALAVVLPRLGDRPTAARVVAAAVLVVASGLVKHNVVAAPIAITAWLAWTDRGALRTWILGGGIILGTSCLVLFLVWGPTIFLDVLAPARSYSFARVAAKGGPLLLYLLPGVLALRPLLRQVEEDERMGLPIAFLAIATPVGIVQRSGAGVDVNAFFEAIVAYAIALPLACSFRREGSFRWFAAAMLPVLALVPAAVLASGREIRGRNGELRDLMPLYRVLGTATGPVGCDDQSICYWAGRISSLDFFALRQRLLQRDVPQLERNLRQGRYAMLVVRRHNPSWQPDRLRPMIAASYVVAHRYGGYDLLVPRRP